MEKNVLNIVITGGPCGGKTTILTELTNLLRSYGYTVLLSDEVATELINAGIKPFGDDKFDLRTFQSFVLDAQLSKEDIRRKAAKLCKNPKVAILYDRGILDNRGYISEEVFSEFLKERKMTEADILTRYDMVIHLVSAAIGKEEYYTTLNNSARTETVAEAREQDRKTLKAWRNHLNLRIVGNDTLFDEKVMKVKNIIRNYIGEKEIVKQERYLVDIDDINIEKLKLKNSAIREEIEEFALIYDTDEIEMYSESNIDGSSYFYSLKKNKKTNTIVCRTISSKEYNYYRKLAKGNMLRKVRYNLIDGDERFRLDIFTMDDKTFAILERDVIYTDRKDLPSFINKAINITNNRDFDDDSLYIDYNINAIYKRKK